MRRYVKKYERQPVRLCELYVNLHPHSFTSYAVHTIAKQSGR